MKRRVRNGITNFKTIKDLVLTSTGWLWARFGILKFVFKIIRKRMMVMVAIPDWDLVKIMEAMIRRERRR